MKPLSKMACEPCRGGVPPLSPQEVAPLAAQVPRWEVVDHHHLQRKVERDDFMQPLRLANRIAPVAEKAGHHPDLLVAYGRLEIKIFTHKIDGLTRNDFILAAKIDEVLDRKAAKRKKSR